MNQGYGLTFAVAVVMALFLLVAGMLFGWLCPANLLSMLFMMVPVVIVLFLVMTGHTRK